MNNIINKLFAAILLCCLSDTAIGEEAALRGMGTLTCGEYSIQSKNDQNYKYATVSWGFGYMTLENMVMLSLKKEYKNIPTVNTTIAYLQKYCSDHPLDEVYKAFDAMYAELGLEKHTEDHKK